jgi:fatty-acyl-CoA synthase
MNTDTDYIELDWLQRWALYSPESIAIESIDQKAKLSYSDLYSRVLSMSNFLSREYGIMKGERVAVLSMNRIEYIIILFAVQRLGALLLPLNYRLASPEIGFQLSDSDAKLLIVEERFREKSDQIEVAPKVIALDKFCEEAEKASSEVNNFHGDFEDPCMILYTSGTTGRPKGALITNKMLFWNSVNTGLRLDLTQKEVILTFAPFFHTGGWNVLTTPVLHRGGKVILLQKFEPEQILELSDQYEASILFGVPTMMAMMAEAVNFENVSLKSIRYAIVGGEPMPIPLIETWQEKGVPIRQGYGLTEFGPNVFSLNEEDAIRKKGSVGFPNFYITAGIFDDDGNELGDESVGELWLKGPVCMAGYWNNEEATNNTIVKGWLKTGDMVRRDTEGYYYIVDRKKDMFISGAENVYPAEIEHVLRNHDQIREVAVVGIPDDTWGEVGKAFIVPKTPGIAIEEIKEFCVKHLAKFKVPKHFVVLDELPKSDTGKILKRELKEYQT